MLKTILVFYCNVTSLHERYYFAVLEFRLKLRWGALAQSSVQGPEGLKPRGSLWAFIWRPREEPSLLGYWRIQFLVAVGLRFPFPGWQLAGVLFQLLDNCTPSFSSALPHLQAKKGHQSFLCLASGFPSAFLSWHGLDKFSVFKVSRDNLAFLRSTPPHEVTQSWE